jgi:hypothetical protein
MRSARRHCSITSFRCARDFVYVSDEFGARKRPAFCARPHLQNHRRSSWLRCLYTASASCLLASFRSSNALSHHLSLRKYPSTSVSEMQPKMLRSRRGPRRVGRAHEAKWLLEHPPFRDELRLFAHTWQCVRKPVSSYSGTKTQPGLSAHRCNAVPYSTVPVLYDTCQLHAFITPQLHPAI